jgi:signal transduction histidine kinase
LTAIAGATQVLQAGAKENPAERDRFLEHIDRHTTRLTRIARGLLSLARAQSGEPLRLDFAELSPLLEELAREAEPADEVTIEVSCASDLAALCEPDLLREALAALVDNAVDHTQAGTVHLAATEEAGRVTVEVADTGSGILPEHRGRLFEPFYRPQASGNGFGLGLAIASQAVEAMGGTLEIAEAEVGSLFTIRLPSARVVT